MAKYNLTNQGGSSTLSVFFENGDSKTLQSTHPTFKETVAYLVGTEPHDEEHLRGLVDPAVGIGRALAAVDPRFSFDLYNLFFEGLPVEGLLADLIKQRLLTGSEGWERFARFLASLEANPSLQAKAGLFSWVQKNGLHIMDDGRFVAHKAVENDGLSGHAGPNNFINGVLLGNPGESVRVPHAVGSVISKRRGDVDDSRVACSTGLHVGTLGYATGFAPRLVTVAVWPEDVVGGDQGFKIRVCRYEVLSLNEDKAEFADGDYDHDATLVDQVSAEEIRQSIESPVLSRHHEFTGEQRAEYNALVSAGRRLYDNLRTQFGKTHDAAHAAAEGTFGLFATSQYASSQALTDDEFDAALDDLADLLDGEDPILDGDTDEEDDEEVAYPAQQPSSDLTLAENAALVDDLRRDLEDPSLGHKPLARKWSNLTTEASVRRYRKAQGISLSLGTKVRDALS